MTLKELMDELKGWSPDLKIEISVGGESCDNPTVELRENEKGNYLEIGTT